MDNSIFLAKVIGLISVISTAAVMVRYKESLLLEEEAIKNSSFAYMSGFFFMILGILIIVSHSIWILDWRLIITLFGWTHLLKGLGRIFFPNSIRDVIKKKKDNHKFILGEVMVFLIGLYLLYVGFIVY